MSSPLCLDVRFAVFRALYPVEMVRLGELHRPGLAGPEDEAGALALRHDHRGAQEGHPQARAAGAPHCEIVQTCRQSGTLERSEIHAVKTQRKVRNALSCVFMA